MTGLLNASQKYFLQTFTKYSSNSPGWLNDWQNALHRGDTAIPAASWHRSWILVVKAAGKQDIHEHVLGAGLQGLESSCFIRVLKSLSLLQENWRTEESSLTLPLLSALEVQLICFSKTTKKILPCYRNFTNYNHFLQMTMKSFSGHYRMEIARIATSKRYYCYSGQD